jgi:hypothetical protein
MGGSTTVSNLKPDLADPVTKSVDATTEAIEAQTAAMEALAACQGQALQNIAQTPLCGASEEEQEALASINNQPVCCQTETLVDTPEAGDTTERTTCDDGQVTDFITYASGDTCTKIVANADPTASTVIFDENNNLCVVTGDPNATCPPRTPGQPYREHYIPLVSDFGNPIFCMPGYAYAFAWGGVDSKSFIQWITDNEDRLAELNDPFITPAGGSIRAEVGGRLYSCGTITYEEDDEGNVTVLPQPDATLPIGADGAGDDFFCFPTLALTNDSTVVAAHTVSNPTQINSTNRAINADGSTLFCPAGDDAFHPLQISMRRKLVIDGILPRGAFTALGAYCPAWDGAEASDAVPKEGFIDTALNFLGVSDLIDYITCDNVTHLELKGKTPQEQYYMLWEDWWKTEKKAKCLQQRVYQAQIPLAIYGLIESLDLYNKLLDKNLDRICTSNDNFNLMAACSDALIGTEDSPGLVKQCETALLEGHNDRIGMINCRGQYACQVATDEFDAYYQLWRGIQHQEAPHLADRLHTMLDNGKFTSEYTMSWARNLDDTLQETVLPSIKKDYNAFVDSANCAANNLNGWRQEVRDKTQRVYNHVDQHHLPGEASMIPLLMNMTECMVSRVCELRDWLHQKAQCDDSTYREYYGSSEGPQARAAMASAAELIPKIADRVRWFEDNTRHVESIFKSCYGDPQATLNPALFQQAENLAPEVGRCFEWFKNQAVKDQDFFERIYRDSECDLVMQHFRHACTLLDGLNKSLEKIDKWSNADRSLYDDHFRSREVEATQELVFTGKTAAEDMTKFGQWFEQKSRDFHEVYNHNWLPADINNLLHHEKVWDRMDPLQVLERNIEDLGKQAATVLPVVESGIQHAQTYLDKVFQEADLFDYALEVPAALHVRDRIDAAQEELERCTSRYASGHLLAASMQLKNQGARSEGAAFEASQRWRFVANEALRRRMVEEQSGGLQVVDGLLTRHLELTQAESSSSAALLDRLNQSVERGRVYIDAFQNSGGLTANMQQNQINNLLQTVQLWHFWPELALRESGEFNAQVQNVLDDSQNLLQLGRFWPEHAQRNKDRGVDVMQQAFDVGLRLSQLGQFYLAQAQSSNAQVASIASGAGQLGNQFAQTGHNLNRIAGDRTQGALGSSVQASQMGLGAAEVGNQKLQQALEYENRMTLNGLEHLKAGISSMGVGVELMREGRNSYQLAGSYGLGAAQEMRGLFRHGLDQGIFGMQANEASYSMNFEMLSYAKNFLQKNHLSYLQAIHGQDVLDNSRLLQGNAENAVGSSFGLLGNSVQGAIQNNQPAPFPTGGFGQGGVGLGTGLSFAGGGF